MRLSIDHRTSYRFTAPQDRLVQRLRLTPENTHDQTVASWHIGVDRDARMRPGCDGFGNNVTTLYCAGPLDAIEITVTGEVVTSHSSGVLRGTAEPLPPALFRRATPLTAPDDAIADFARGQQAEGTLATLHRLNAAVCERWQIDPGRPVAGCTAAEAFAGEAATARDLAHVFIAAARSLGIPARYVGGYCDLAGDSRPTPHAWADAHVAGLGWVGFDPTLGASPEEHHVRVAVGLDAAGAAPVSGSRLGEGEERLDVEVSVASDD